MLRINAETSYNNLSDTTKNILGLPRYFVQLSPDQISLFTEYFDNIRNFYIEQISELENEIDLLEDINDTYEQ